MSPPLAAILAGTAGYLHPAGPLLRALSTQCFPHAGQQTGSSCAGRTDLDNHERGRETSRPTDGLHHEPANGQRRREAFAWRCWRGPARARRRQKGARRGRRRPGPRRRQLGRLERALERRKGAAEKTTRFDPHTCPLCTCRGAVVHQQYGERPGCGVRAAGCGVRAMGWGLLAVGGVGGGMEGLQAVGMCLARRVGV